MKKIINIVALVLCFVFLLSVTSMASIAPYTTYTYDSKGEVLPSPDAYVPDKEITNYNMNMDTPLLNPKDIFVDSNMNIYVSDTGNKRVIVCNPEFQYQFEITTFVNKEGVPDALEDPQGLFVTDKYIYVCDALKARIVLFTLAGEFVDIIYAPEADIMGTDTAFYPVAVSVDGAGRMYVVSSQTYSGILSYDENANFESFIGVQKASVSLAVKLRRMFFPNSAIDEEITTGYLNCTIDDQGFVWATVDTSENPDTFENAVESNNADYAPVKRLNISGVDVMTRSGFHMPAGEINFQRSSLDGTGVSLLKDIALGPNGMWAVIDSTRSKVFVYDRNGILLFAFGDKGQQLGNLVNATAVTFFGSDLYVLDSSMNSITTYKRTAYGDTINRALYNDLSRNWTEALNDWREILKFNVNFDSAYVGVGKNLVRSEDYVEAMVNFKAATDTTHYSEAFKLNREKWINKNFIVIPIVVVVLCILLVKGLSYVGKVNKAGMTKVGKRTFWEEVLFGFYIIMHPFDGFWDLKHEKRGSVRGAIFWVAVATVVNVYNTIGASWMSNPAKETANVLYLMATVLIPLFLWVVGNWCLTTLFDGEGNFKDIFITSAYALVPMVVLCIPATLLSNVLSLDEVAIATLLKSISFVWMGFLLFFGIMTTHGYSMGKNLLITICTIVAMVFIAFLIMLFSNLVSRMVSFVSEIITEISYRQF